MVWSVFPFFYFCVEGACFCVPPFFFSHDVQKNPRRGRCPKTKKDREVTFFPHSVVVFSSLPFPRLRAAHGRLVPTSLSCPTGTAPKLGHTMGKGDFMTPKAVRFFGGLQMHTRQPAACLRCHRVADAATQTHMQRWRDWACARFWQESCQKNEFAELRSLGRRPRGRLAAWLAG